MEMPQLASMKIAVIYGSDTGDTEEIGENIAERLANLGCGVEIMEVSDCDFETIQTFDLIIMGIPTWDFGGVQSDWEERESELRKIDLTGKVVALYGLGDQRGFSDFFLDAMGWLHEHVTKAGATIVGRWPTEGYEFDESRATNHDKSEFFGLGIDELQQGELTDQRLDTWVAQVLAELKEKADLHP